jgi:hypothetical protein
MRASLLLIDWTADTDLYGESHATIRKPDERFTADMQKQTWIGGACEKPPT